MEKDSAKNFEKTRFLGETKAVARWPCWLFGMGASLFHV